MSKTRNLLSTLPQITKYGTTDILLQSSIKPQIKLTTSSTIQVLKEVAFHHKLVSLSANQIGLQERVFVTVQDHLLRPGKWDLYGEVFQRAGGGAGEIYQGVVNAVEVSSCYEQYFGFQECPSFPGLKFKVKMPIFINIKYISELSLLAYLKSNPKTLQPPNSLYTEQSITGFRARVWDHEIRHLQGILPIQENVCNGEFFLLDSYKQNLQNIQYYENLRNIQKNFKRENLKKMEKELEKDKGMGKKGGNFMDLPEQIKNGGSGEHMKSKSMKQPTTSKKSGSNNKHPKK